MWPRLVANKILGKRSGCNNFVADFPTNESRLEDNDINSTPGLGQPSLTADSIFNHHTDTHNFKLFVSTWNVGGIAPPQDLDMEDWLDTTNNMCDIYVLGFQEIVPLRASNVLGSENTKISMEWNSLIRKALNKKKRIHSQGKHPQQQDDDVVDDDDRLGKRQNLSSIQESEKETEKGISAQQDFGCIISKQMVGILISVWVRGDLRPYIRYPSVACVGCGVMGCLGNKGSVSVRFRLHETGFCFVCSHLASGGREGDEKHRNSDVAEILSRTTFPRGPSLGLPRKILDHDRVILLGDLNYRIALPEATTRLLVDRKDWGTLLENDQLKMELMNGRAFEGWDEGIIKFAPTYKYCTNSNLYYGCLEGKKVEKWRAPAWCDRIIWYGEGLKQHLYTRGELNFSDHRPVKAIFATEVEVLRTIRGLQGFFLSERFDQMTSKSEMTSLDRCICHGSLSFKM